MAKNKNGSYESSFEEETFEDFETPTENKPKKTIDNKMHLCISLKKDAMVNLTVNLVNGLGVLDKNHPTIELYDVSLGDYKALQTNKNIVVTIKEV
jgi:hypothetical protein